jgi:hypothetical protein
VETLVALHRNHFGEIISFVTSTGRIISYRKALVEMESGFLQGVKTTEDTDGTMLLIPETEQTFDHFPELF